MELIDDWKDRTPLPASPEGIRNALKAFEPNLLSVHCYEDVGYPWVALAFHSVISPQVVLDAGEALAAAGVGGVYFNSLRPRALSFLVGQAFDPLPGQRPPQLPISRYGELLDSLEKAWG